MIRRSPWGRTDRPRPHGPSSATRTVLGRTDRPRHSRVQGTLFPYVSSKERAGRQLLNRRSWVRRRRQCWRLATESPAFPFSHPASLGRADPRAERRGDAEGLTSTPRAPELAPDARTWTSGVAGASRRRWARPDTATTPSGIGGIGAWPGRLDPEAGRSKTDLSRAHVAGARPWGLTRISRFLNDQANAR